MLDALHYAPCMSAQATTGNRSFGQWVRDTWAAGMAIRVIVEKEDRRIVDLPLNVIIIAGILAPWALGIGVVVAVVTGYRMYTERPVPAQDTTAAASEQPPEPAREASTAPDAVAEADITPPPGTGAGERAPEPPPGA
jgi:hypothetical protein